MISDLDIFRAAQLLVKRHGADAAVVASQRADELLDAGDLNDVAVWKSIMRVVEELALKAEWVRQSASCCQLLGGMLHACVSQAVMGRFWN